MALKKKTTEKEVPRKFILGVKQIFEEAAKEKVVPRTTASQLRLLKQFILGPKKKKRSLLTATQK